MIAQELEVCLHRAFVEARDQHHEFITVEHLLLALLDCPTAAQVLRASSANIDGLREKLTQQVAQQTPRVPADRDPDTQPTLGFQRVIQRAILHVQSSGKKEVTGAYALGAIFGEKDSHAVRILEQHGITRFEVVSHLAHGAAPSAASLDADLPEGADLQVVLYNDDYTPMEFVVEVLQKFFAMTEEEAKETMLEVHRQGVGLCGLYARKEALQVMKAVLEYARQHRHPLRCGVVAPE